jgi:hypothetical protein
VGHILKGHKSVILFVVMMLVTSYSYGETPNNYDSSHLTVSEESFNSDDPIDGDH